MSDLFPEGSIFKETPKKEVAAKREPVKEDFVYKNIVNLCGKIVKVYPSGRDGTVFVLSCGHGRKQKKNKDGLILRNVIPVYFYDQDAKFYAKKYKVGDFVTVNGVAQTIKGFSEDRTSIWGLSMGPKYFKGRKPIMDKNMVAIRGKIDRTTVLNPNYVIVNVYTYTEKSRPNPNKESSNTRLTAMYKSITPIGIRCHGNAREVARLYTKGTWIDCRGFVDDRAVGDKGMKKMHIIATHVDVIGQIQREME